MTEDLALKNKLWKELDGLCPQPTIFASNTSSLPIVAMAAATKRQDRFVGMHFFNPVPVMQLVEIVKAVGTSQETFDRAFAFAKSLGKEAISAKDTPGFVVNRLLVPYMVDAIRAFENGVGSVVDIDIGMKLGAGHPIGPLALTDLVGLDTALKVSDILYAEFSEQRYSAPPLLRRLVTAGHLGRKTGRGFYDYSVNPAVPALLIVGRSSVWLGLSVIGLVACQADHHPPDLRPPPRRGDRRGASRPRGGDPGPGRGVQGRQHSRSSSCMRVTA